jgi:pilus assembly protein CpaF
MSVGPDLDEPGPTAPHLAEPDLAEPDLVEQVRERLARQAGEVTPHRVAEALRSTGRPVGDATVLAVHEALRREVVGAGALEPLLRLPGVTDVLVNGPDAVYLERGRGLERADVCFPGDAAVRRLAQRLAASGGRRLDDATPYVDVRLRDGTRFHAVLAPLARPGTLLSLRVPHRRVLSLEELLAVGTVTEHGARLLRALVRRRLAFLISGGTGSGKTTLLNSLLSLAPPDQRVVIVEDASELRPAHPHVVALEARPPNIEGAGEVTLRTLVRQALRMRPDRLVVGEVRGAEVVDLLAALNTGHEGGCGTVHANSARDVPARIEALCLAAGLSRDAAHSQFLAGVDVVLHVGRDIDGQRVLRDVAVPSRGADGLAAMLTAVSFPGGGEAVTGPGEPALAARLS